MWCVAKLDEEYIARMEDVLGLYEKPLSASEPVVCIDEKPVVLHEDTCAPIPDAAGTSCPARLRIQAMRNRQRVLRRRAQGGTALHQGDADALLSRVRRLPAEDRRRYPAADTIHLVMDNLSTHTRKALGERFGEKAGSWLWDRFTIHYTPKHGSWLNQAEMEVSLFSRQCLGKRRIGNIAALRKQARAWNRRVNQAQGHNSVEVHAPPGPKNTSLHNHAVKALGPEASNPSKLPLTVFVLDHVERPTANYLCPKIANS